jgi:hypothetical protein
MVTDTTTEQLARNLTPEVRDYFAARLARIANLAATWPVRGAVSHTRDGYMVEGTKSGTRVLHLLCWLPDRSDDPTYHTATHCGQAVSILALGQVFYLVTSEDIQRGIRLHIAQCHMEEVEQ